MSCVYHSRTKGEGCGHLKSIKAPPAPPTPTPSKVFTDRFKAVLLLWFTISTIVYVFALYVLVIFFILNSRLANCLGKKGSFWLSLRSILIVVPLLLSASFFHFGFLNGSK